MTEHTDVPSGDVGNDEVRDWFWGVVALGSRCRYTLETVLAGMSDSQLCDFERSLLDLASSLHSPRFLPPEFGEWDDWVDSVAQRVVSQGRDYFLQVCTNPDLFWKLLQEDGYDAETSYEGIAGRVWRERHHQDMPPV